MSTDGYFYVHFSILKRNKCLLYIFLHNFPYSLYLKLFCKDKLKCTGLENIGHIPYYSDGILSDFGAIQVIELS